MIIGIDLGTTNSLVSYFSEEGPKIIPNRMGKNLTPSVVSIDEEGQLYVGEAAKERMLLYPDSAASVFKRAMGTKRPYQLLDKTFYPEELSSFVLRALKEDAEAFLGQEIKEAVISVPAYFDDNRRRATKKAGELAGLTVERIISEPTAAAITYGLSNHQDISRFLVFDLGGGTFDVSILELTGPLLEVRSVAGDNFLGGEDFTSIIENLFFERTPALDRLSLNERTLRHIHKQAEQCKLGFSDSRISVMKCHINHQEYTMELDLSDYEEACSELLERIRKPVKRSLSDAELHFSEIDQIVLVGGATKCPVVRRFVNKLFHVFPDQSVNPDEAVALGAAIQAAMKERNEAIKEIILTDVCPFTLGTNTVKEWSKNNYESGVFCPIIERNTIIPASFTHRFYTISDNQTKIRVEVLQGESRLAANNLLLGEILVDVPPAKAGNEAIDITYTYDINSILEVEIKVLSTNEVIRQIFRGQNVDMTDEEIEERFKLLSYLKLHPRDRDENKYLLLRAERLYEESLGAKRDLIQNAIHDFDQVLSSYNLTDIHHAREQFSRFLEEMEY